MLLGFFHVHVVSWTSPAAWKIIRRDLGPGPSSSHRNHGTVFISSLLQKLGVLEVIGCSGQPIPEPWQRSSIIPERGGSAVGSSIVPVVKGSSSFSCDSHQRSSTAPVLHRPFQHSGSILPGVAGFVGRARDQLARRLAHPSIREKHALEPPKREVRLRERVVPVVS